MASVFNSLKPAKLNHSNFNLSYENKFTCRFGALVPVCVKEMLPGDVFRYNIENVVRFQPTVSPSFHKFDIRVEAFFIPNRIIWSDWEDFITGADESVSVPTLSVLKRNTYQSSSSSDAKEFQFSFFDYIGTGALNSGSTYTDPIISALPWRAYKKVFNDWYLVPEVQTPYDIEDDTSSTNNYYHLFNRNWSGNDYFTSALPYTTQGVEPTIDYDLGVHDVLFSDDRQVEGPVMSAGSYFALNGNVVNATSVGDTDKRVVTMRPDQAVFDGFVNRLGLTRDLGDSTMQLPSKISLGHVDLSDAGVSITANELRRLMASEQFLERNARAGNRYVDQVLSRFNTFVGDARLDRAEFLGSSKSTISIGEIPNTSSTNQGKLVGKGFGGLASRMCRYRAKEHGYFMVLMSIVPKLGYFSDGFSREFQRFDRLDYFTPEFEHIGEIAIKQKELFFDRTSVNRETANFGGYAPIYTEYRYSKNITSSGFHSLPHDDLGTHNWTSDREFKTGAPPLLNSSFLSIENDNDGIYRIFGWQIPSYYLMNQACICSVQNLLYAYRPISKFGEPGIAVF